VPLYKGLLKARLGDGGFQTCIVMGLDDATLIGGPPEMAEGSLADLRRSESIVVDEVGARTKLAFRLRDGTTRPLRVGDAIEINDHRAQVVGICRVSRTFQSQPVVYTTYQRAMSFAPRERKLLSFILAAPVAGRSPTDVARAITAATGLGAYEKTAFRDKTRDYYMKFTGIPINFGISVALGFIVGTAIAGQTFYNFTLDNLRYFGALKAMGASNGQMLRMILVQSLAVGAIGYGIGVGAASAFGFVAGHTELAFHMPWWLPLASAAAIVLICGASALFSIWRVVRLEPAVVFRS
jgi:putative ABC transport system permease protein